MDIKQIYREETELDIYTTINLDDGWCFSNDYVKWLEKQLLIQRVSHQRELLKAYTKWLDDKLRDSDELDELMDDYFRSL